MAEAQEKAWRVTAGDLSSSDHYLEHEGRRWPAGVTQDAHWLADYLNALEAEKERYKTALEEIASMFTYRSPRTRVSVDIARAALDGTAEKAKE